MRILLDECVDWRLLRDLTQHEVKSARQASLASTDDGDLLRHAQLEFDAVVVLQGRTSRLHHLRELVPQLLADLPLLVRGSVHWITWRDHS